MTTPFSASDADSKRATIDVIVVSQIPHLLLVVALKD